jgi:hypothetical protein
MLHYLRVDSICVMGTLVTFYDEDDYLYAPM